MRFLYHAQDPELPPAFHSFAEERVLAILGHLTERLTQVEVHMKDTNAHKQGIDKRCVIEARPRGMDPVAAEHEAAEARDALVGAGKKLENLLTSRFGRRDAHPPRGGPRATTA
ncbi:MAG: HPF/RaiA family ribosome-associated protein [Planctomycetota bacterium]